MSGYSDKEKLVLEKFGHRLKKFRNAIGVSQEELAEIAGLHRTYIGSAERGERNVSLLNLLILAEAVQCNLSDLIDQ